MNEAVPRASRTDRLTFPRLLAVAWMCAGAVLLLVPLPNVYRANWWSQLLDLGHVPLFVCVTVGLRQFLPGKIVPVALTATALAGVAELCQPMVGRSMQLSDFGYGVAGVIAVSIGVVGFQSFQSRRGRVVCTAIAVAVSLTPALLSRHVLVDAWFAWRSFPILADFESSSEDLRWYQNGALPRRVQNGLTGEWSGEFRFTPARSDAVLLPVVADWHGWQRLCCEFSIDGEPMELLISIRDGRRVQAPQVRFDLVQQFPAGQHQVKIELPSLERGDAYAPLDLTRIQSFHLSAPGLQTERVILLHRIYLE